MTWKNVSAFFPFFLRLSEPFVRFMKGKLDFAFFCACRETLGKSRNEARVEEG